MKLIPIERRTDNSWVVEIGLQSPIRRIMARTLKEQLAFNVRLMVLHGICDPVQRAMRLIRYWS